MIQIIGGKRYNTETATKVAHYWNGRGSGDFGALSETIYITPKGAWFLEYSGGASTKYAQSCGQNSRCGSSGLRALSNEEAFDWLEDNHEAAALEKYFADRLTDA